MKSTDFKTFSEKVATANENDCIWYAGYLFINLTFRQQKIIIECMKKNPCCYTRFTEQGYEFIYTPAGIGFLLND